MRGSKKTTNEPSSMSDLEFFYGNVLKKKRGNESNITVNTVNFADCCVYKRENIFCAN